MSRHACEFCGVDFSDDEIMKHKKIWHQEELAETEREREELIVVLNKQDEKVKHKAKMYDKLVVKALMSCGMIESGDEIKYIVDPDTFTDIILSEILSDIKIDRFMFVELRSKMIKTFGGIDEQGN